MELKLRETVFFLFLIVAAIPKGGIASSTVESTAAPTTQTAEKSPSGTNSPESQTKQGSSGAISPTSEQSMAKKGTEGTGNTSSSTTSSSGVITTTTASDGLRLSTTWFPITILIMTTLLLTAL